MTEDRQGGKNILCNGVSREFCNIEKHPNKKWAALGCPFSHRKNQESGSWLAARTRCAGKTLTEFLDTPCFNNARLCACVEGV